MGIAEIVSAVVQAYMEREKKKENHEQALEIIRAINHTVAAQASMIKDALLDIQLDELTGRYLGRVEYFKEYTGTNDHKVILETISSDTNDIIGILRPIYSRESHVPTVRKIVRLEILVLSLRALVMSELKHRHGDNRDIVLLGQLETQKGHCNWVVENQLITLNNARDAFKNHKPEPGPICLPDIVGDISEGIPTSCNHHLWEIVMAEKNLHKEDTIERDKINDAINTINS